MYPRLFIPLLVVLSNVGCSFHHDLPLRDSFAAISIGNTLPTDSAFDFESGVELVSRWENATGVTESAGVLLDSTRRVHAKKYQLRGEEGKLALMLYIRRDRTEWVIRRQGDTTDDELRDHVNRSASELAHVGSGHDPADLLERAWSAKRTGRSTYRRVSDRRWFPMSQAKEERVRFGDDRIEILIEERKDIPPLVWAVLGWTSFLAGGAFH